MASIQLPTLTHATVPLFADASPPDPEPNPNAIDPPCVAEWGLGPPIDDSHPRWTIPAEHMPIEQSFRHSWWDTKRRRVYDVLAGMGVSPRRLINFQNCGSFAQVEVQDKTGQVRVTSCKCHDRSCQACGEERSRIIAENLWAKCQGRKTLHVVLTQLSTDDDLGTCMDRLYRHFTRLRQRPWWKLHCIGGCYAFETTLNTATGQWHPHLHILAEADYLDQRTLRGEWLAVTGDSHVAKVSLVGNGKAIAREVTKYIGKPIHRSIDGDAIAMQEVFTALHGRRLITTFGSWRGVSLTERGFVEEPTKWTRVCTLIELHSRAANGDTWSIQTLRYLNSRRPGREHAGIGIPTAPPPAASHATPPSG